MDQDQDAENALSDHRSTMTCQLGEHRQPGHQIELSAVDDPANKTPLLIA